MKQKKQLGKTNVVWASFIAVVLCIVVGNAILAMNTIQSLTQTQQRLDDTGMLNTAIEKLHLSIVQAESGQRGFLLTGDEAYLAPYYDAILQLNSQAKLVKGLRTEIDGQADKVARLLYLVDDKVAILTRTADLALADNERRVPLSLKTRQGRKIYEEIRLLANETKKTLNQPLSLFNFKARTNQKTIFNYCCDEWFIDYWYVCI